MVAETLGDRMKNYYENAYKVYLPRKSEIIIRIDGQHFHTFTKGCKKPFDEKIMEAMYKATQYSAEKMQGFKLAYTQSDEASFWINDKMSLESDAWFGNSLQKICSISASMFTSYFDGVYEMLLGKDPGFAFFDARAFIIPTEEVANYFLWRAKDWERNSLNMYCESFFSHKQLDGMSNQNRHEMLHKIGKNWTTDLTDIQKNGTFYDNNGIIHWNVKPTYEEINKLIGGMK